jgi:hypothetical protein
MVQATHTHTTKGPVMALFETLSGAAAELRSCGEELRALLSEEKASGVQHPFRQIVAERRDRAGAWMDGIFDVIARTRATTPASPP